MKFPSGSDGRALVSGPSAIASSEMTDVMTRAQRSRNMSRIRGKDTGIEMRVRRALHALGYRYRLHVRDLPGRPDIVLPKYRTVIFVNGCFWHSHGCRLSVKPSTRAAFWERKLHATVERDRANHKDLERRGWNVIDVWECELGTKSSDRSHSVAARIRRELEARS